MDNYWFEIMHSLNILIPRPDESASHSHKTATTPSSKVTTKDPLKSVLPPTGSNLVEDDSSLLSKSEKNRTYPSLLLSEYGKPRYKHLNQTSWELLVLSRCLMEDLVKELEIDVSIVPDHTAATVDMDVLDSLTLDEPWTLDPSILRQTQANSKQTIVPPFSPQPKRSDIPLRMRHSDKGTLDDPPVLDMPPRSRLANTTGASSKPLPPAGDIHSASSDAVKRSEPGELKSSPPLTIRERSQQYNLIASKTNTRRIDRK